MGSNIIVLPSSDHKIAANVPHLLGPCHKKSSRPSLHYYALSKAQPENFELPCTDVFLKIQPFISSLWQERWDKEVGNKLHAIMPQIDEKYYSGCTNRKDDLIINRLRIGHTRLTHSFRMENRPHPP